MKILFLILFSAIIIFANVGKVTAVKGDVSIKRATKILKATSGFILKINDKIITKNKSKVLILFNDKTSMTIGNNSTLSVKEFVLDIKNSSKSKAVFGFGKGLFRTITGKIGKINPKGFKIKTKTSSIGIRGTTLDTSVKILLNGNEQVDVAFIEGRGMITSDITGITTNVNTGQRANLQANGQAKVEQGALSQTNSLDEDSKELEQEKQNTQQNNNEDSSNNDENNQNSKGNDENSKEEDKEVEKEQQNSNKNNQNSETSDKNSKKNINNNSNSNDNNLKSKNIEKNDLSDNKDALKTNIIKDNSPNTPNLPKNIPSLPSVDPVDTPEPNKLPTITGFTNFSGTESSQSFYVLASDPDGNDLTYSIVSHSDNLDVSIDPKTGKIIASLNSNYKKGDSVSILVRVVDSNGGSFEKSFSTIPQIKETPNPEVEKEIAKPKAEEEIAKVDIFYSTGERLNINSDEFTEVSKEILGTDTYDNTKVMEYGYLLNSEKTKRLATFVDGIQTPSSVIESYLNKNITASYKGGLAGFVINNGSVEREASGKINLDFDFNDNSLSGDIQIDRFINANINKTSNTVTANGFGSDSITAGKGADSEVNGKIEGKFYGPQASSVGGTLDLDAGGMLFRGAFGAKKQ